MTPDSGKGSSEAVSMGERVFWRATAPLVDPLSTPLSTRTAGRCHQAGDACPLYGSLDASTPFFEIQRHADIDLTGAKIRLSELSFSGMLFDGTTPRSLEEAGVEGHAVVADADYRAAWRLVAYAWRVGADALLLPSAARTGSTSIVVAHSRVSSTVGVANQQIVSFESGLRSI